MLIHLVSNQIQPPQVNSEKGVFMKQETQPLVNVQPKVETSEKADVPVADKKKEKKPRKRKAKEKENLTNISIPSKGDPASIRRQLEMEAYAAIIMAFRAEGELTWKKENLLLELRNVMKISDERHRQEVQRVEEALSHLFPAYTSFDESHHSGRQGLGPTLSDGESVSEGEEAQRYLCCHYLIFKKEAKNNRRKR